MTDNENILGEYSDDEEPEPTGKGMRAKIEEQQAQIRALEDKYEADTTPRTPCGWAETRPWSGWRASTWAPTFAGGRSSSSMAGPRPTRSACRWGRWWCYRAARPAASLKSAVGLPVSGVGS